MGRKRKMTEHSGILDQRNRLIYDIIKVGLGRPSERAELYRVAHIFTIREHGEGVLLWEHLWI